MTASVLKQDPNIWGQKGKRNLFITTKHNMRIFGLGPFFQATKQHLYNNNKWNG